MMPVLSRLVKLGVGLVGLRSMLERLGSRDLLDLVARYARDGGEIGRSLMKKPPVPSSVILGDSWRLCAGATGRR
jgi:hypothetical protein